VNVHSPVSGHGLFENVSLHRLLVPDRHHRR
jgi:hypothetical protein